MIDRDITRDTTFTMRVDVDTRNVFAALAKSVDLTASQLMRRLMRDYIAAHTVRASQSLTKGEK